MYSPRIAFCFICGVLFSLITDRSSFAQAPKPNAKKTGNLKIRFTYKGDVPKPQRIEPKLDAEFCGALAGGIKDESLIVNPKNKGIKNVIVYLYTGRRGVKLPPQKLGNKIRDLTINNCVFKPHVMVAEVGDTIRVIPGPGPVVHNVNFAFFNMPPMGPAIPRGGNQMIKLARSEPAVVPVRCNIHSWMNAYVLVTDHPFAAISDENGGIEIKGIPAGKDMIFRAWHEVGTFRNKIFVNGQQAKWNSNKFEVEIKSGLNDLGTVEIPADEFDL